MKIATWNCNGGFGRGGKAERVFGWGADLVVIEECSERDAVSVGYAGYTGLWAGRRTARGVAVFWRRGWRVELLAEPEGDLIVPLRVRGRTEFTLLAVWACMVKGSRRESYVGQIHRVMKAHPEWFGGDAGEPTVVVGDFNSNAIWDEKRPGNNHSAMVAEMMRFGLVSAYHAFFAEEHGGETRPTFHLYRQRERSYHLDYVFVPAGWMRGATVKVGRHAAWCGWSDHCPVMVEVR